MKVVRRENTAPELVVRRYLHSRGLRYSLHSAGLVGRPDLVLPGRRTVVYVHGCFWHGHDCKHGSVETKTNIEFWRRKLAENKTRDARHQAQLRAAGWFVEVVWECQLRDTTLLARLARRMLARGQAS